MEKKHFRWDGLLIRFVEYLTDVIFISFSFLIVLFIINLTKTGNLTQAFNMMFAKSIKEDVPYYYQTVITLIYYDVSLSLLFAMYHLSVTKYNYQKIVLNVLLCLVLSNFLAMIITALVPEGYFISIQAICLVFLMQLFLILFHKFCFYRIIFKKNIHLSLICGPKEEAITLAKKFYIEPIYNRVLKYIFIEENGEINKKIYSYIDKVDRVYLTSSLNEKNKNKIMTYCIARKYVDVYLVPQIYEVGIINSNIDKVDDQLVFSIQSLHLSISQRFIKRTFDIVFSVIGLILTFPIFIIVAILIKLQDGGSVFFKQERLTRNNKKFYLIKFRTMIENAEEKTGAIWARKDDVRITKLGRLLRKTRIDELPQLINVLKSEMSFVGPRPEREVFVNEFMKENPNFQYRLNVKSGITGLAQTLGKYSTNPNDKLRFDLLYIRKYSILYDLEIIFYTIKSIFDRESSTGVIEEDELGEIIKKCGFKEEIQENIIEIVNI